MTAKLALHMYKKEHNSCWKLQSTEITETTAAPEIDEARVWLTDEQGRKLPLIPFFIIPTLLGDFEKESKLMVYEAYNGQSMKFFSPENIVKETSGEILQRLKLLLREKQKEVPYTPDNFGRMQLLERLSEENTWVMETLLREKKIIKAVYQQRQAMEIKLREWIGARANIFFIAAEAGSGKTNLLAEMLNQYSERKIPCLFIRAARMQKDSLQGELAYRLNIEENYPLRDYGIAGTQAEPTIILLDGLNEAKNSEQLWDEMLQLSKQFEPGGLKFVVGNRANAKDDLNRYTISDADEALLYGEKKENEKGLYAYAHWLKPMDMQEMKGAWNHYYRLDKSIYRPNFDFDKITQFDRGIYNQISNPLVMRLFLELYHGKSLPKKGRHLNIWKDWFNSFSAEEQSFMQKLAALIWENGANELLFDSVQKSESMKAFFADDKSKIPYQRLLKNGWISRYSKDLDAYIAFTVEGLLLYILGLKLYNQSPEIDLAAVEDLMKSAKKLKKAALDSYLAELAQRDEMELITELIDAGGDKIGICIAPLFIYMKNRGVKATIDKVLENATEYDWEALLRLDNRIQSFQLHQLRKEYLTELMYRNEFSSKNALWLGLRAIEIFDKKEAIEYLEKIDQCFQIILDDEILLEMIGIVEDRFGNYDKAIEYYEKSLAIGLKVHGDQHLSIGQTYNNLGVAWRNKGEYDKAIEFYEKSLAILLKVHGDQHPSIGGTYNNLGLAWSGKGDYDKAIEYYEKSLTIKLKVYGDQHPSVGRTYNNLGTDWGEKGNYDKAIEYYEKSLAIDLKVHGDQHPSLVATYKNIAQCYESLHNYSEALSYYLQAAEIRKAQLGLDDPKTIEVMEACRRLAKELNREGDLPDWMK
jgi:tetratricopeptide (TPR) repeat protein